LPFTLITGIAVARGYKARKTTGEREARVEIDRRPPVLGDNNIESAVGNVQGEPIMDVKILVNHYTLPNGACELHDWCQVKRE